MQRCQIIESTQPCNTGRCGVATVSTIDFQYCSSIFVSQRSSPTAGNRCLDDYWPFASTQRDARMMIFICTHTHRKTQGCWSLSLDTWCWENDKQNFTRSVSSSCCTTENLATGRLMECHQKVLLNHLSQIRCPTNIVRQSIQQKALGMFQENKIFDGYYNIYSRMQDSRQQQNCTA